MRTVRDVEPKTATSTFTSFWALINKFKFNVALRPQGPQGLFGTGSPARLPRLSHSSWALYSSRVRIQCCFTSTKTIRPRLSHSSWALYSSRVSFYTSFFFFFFFFFFQLTRRKERENSAHWLEGPTKVKRRLRVWNPSPPPPQPPPHHITGTFPSLTHVLTYDHLVPFGEREFTERKWFWYVR